MTVDYFITHMMFNFGSLDRMWGLTFTLVSVFLISIYMNENLTNFALHYNGSLTL